MRSLFLLPIVCASSLALAQTAAPEEAAEAPAVIEPQAASEESATEAAKAAAEAAKAAAEAAKASAAALQQAVSALEAAKAPAAEEPAAEAAPAAPSPWTYQLGVSFISITGNANAVTGRIGGQAEGKWGDWSTKFMAGAAYGQTTAQTTDESLVTALNANASAKGQRSLGGKFNAYLLAGALTDRVASITYQGYGEAGVGLTWWETVEGDFVKSRLTTDLGFRYTREAKAIYYPDYTDLPDSDIYSPALKASFRYAITKNAVFTEDVEVLPDVVDTANLRATSKTALSAQIGGGVSLALSFNVRYIGVPAEGARKTDTELGAGVNWTF